MQSPTSKTKPNRSAHLQFEAIGTQWTIDVVATEEIATELSRVIATRVTEFDTAYSRFRKDSLVTTISLAAGSYELPADASPMMDLYTAMYAATGGQVTPLIGQALSDAGYDADYSFAPKRLVGSPKWEDVMQYRKPILTTSQPTLLDFGAAGKGYLIDILSEIIESYEIDEYCVDGSGDMRQRGRGALRIGLEDPDNAERVLGITELHNQSLCGSAGNRRKWGNYHHILNPQTLVSPQHVKAVWTVADTTLLADGMATCLFFSSPQALQAQFNFEYVVYHEDGRAEVSKNFPGALI